MNRTAFWKWDRIILGIIVGLLLLTILLISFPDNKKSEESSAESPAKRILYLPALPIRFVYENPDCTNKLIAAMNITNVKIGDPI